MQLYLGLAWWRGERKSDTFSSNILVSHMSKLNAPYAWSKVADILDIEPLIVSLSCLLNYWIGDLQHISCISPSTAVNTALLIECNKVEHFSSCIHWPCGEAFENMTGNFHFHSFKLLFTITGWPIVSGGNDGGVEFNKQTKYAWFMHFQLGPEISGH